MLVPRPPHSLVKRLRYIRAFIVVTLMLIMGRLFQLQIHLFETFFTRGQRNFLRTEKVVAPRGNIVDTRGRPLATSRPLITLYWQGSGKKTRDRNQQMLINYLETLLGKDLNQDAEFLLAEQSGKRYTLERDMDFSTFSRLLEHFPHHANLSFTTSFKRSYPYGSLACHILGYLGSITTTPAGKMGLEKIYENELKGNPGEIQKKINSRGHQLAAEEIQKACKGQDLEITIDLNLQQIAEAIFPVEHAGVLLIIQPRTGALKTVISRPAFDPNIFLDSLDAHTWHNIQEDRQSFLNRAFSALYPPASLFKLVSISAAFDTGIVDYDDVWTCNGFITFAGRPYYCNNHKGHGKLTTLEAVAQSCNIPFYEIGKRIKIDTLADYAHRFNLGSKTNIVFPEKAGLIPTSAWKRHYKGERWWPGETLSAAIGQSFLSVTPIQMAMMVSAICEGYLVKPCILKAEAESPDLLKTPLRVSDRTREFLKQSMSRSVKGGTGRRLNRLGSMEIYAKTGTAQTSSLEKRTQGKRYLEHGWAIAYIRYQDCEPITLLVLLENVGSSQFAIDVIKNLIIQYRALVSKYPEEYRDTMPDKTLSCS